MRPAAVVVVGAGGAGREALDILAAHDARSGRGSTLVGVVDDAPRPGDLARLERRGVRHLGDVASLAAWLTPMRYVIGVADPAARRAIDRRLADAGHRAHTVVHPAATVGSASSLGPGSLVGAGARLSTEVTTGRHTHVGAGALIGHDTMLASFTTVNPGAIVSGGVVLGECGFVGAGAVVLQGLRVGAGAVVGAAACVTRDVEPGATVKGVPAR